MNHSEITEIDFEDLGVLYNEELNIIAQENITKYNLLYEDISKKNSSNLIWWISSVASRNPHQTNHYLNFCKLILLSKIIKDNNKLRNIYVPNLIIKNNVKLITNEFNKNIYINVKKNLYYINNLKRLLSFFFKNFKTLFFLKIINFNFRKSIKIPEKNINIFEIFDSENFDGINRYYPNINNYIQDNNEIFFYTDILIDNFTLYKNKIKNLYNKNNNYLIKNQFVRITDLFIYFFYYFFKNKIIYSGKSIFFDELARHELANSFMSEMSFKSFLSYQVFKRLKKRGLKINNFVDWWENQPLDKSVSFAISSQFSDCNIIANLGYIPRKNEFQLSPLKIEIDLKVVPNIFLVSGKEVANVIKLFYNNIRFKIVPSLRYLDIMQKYNQALSINKLTNSKNKVNILVGLTIYKSESYYILNCIKNYINKSTHDLQIFVKCHPSNIIDVKKYFNNNNKIQIYNDFIFEKDFKLAITGMSTISYELLTFGIPVIICNDSTNFNFIPNLTKINNKFWKLSSNQKEFNSFINSLICSYNFILKEKQSLSEFVKNNYFEYQSLDTIESLYT